MVNQNEDIKRDEKVFTNKNSTNNINYIFYRILIKISIT